MLRPGLISKEKKPGLLHPFPPRKLTMLTAGVISPCRCWLRVV
jgi:hypothetical protein